MPDPHLDFAYSTVATAPSPAGSGLSLTVTSGEGSRFPQPSTDGAFNAVVCASGQTPIWAAGGNTGGNFEVVRVTARSGDTMTIARAQDGSTARTVLVGDQFFLADLAKLWQDIERSSPVVNHQGRIWKQAISPTTPSFPISQQIVSGSGTSYNAFPWVCATKYGVLMMVYRHGATHTSTDGVVTARTSTDGGVTWSGGTAIASPAAGHDYRDPSIVCTKTGRLIVNFFDSNGSSVIGLYSIYSDDGGTTWSSPTSPASVFSSWTATSGAILQHSSGALLWPVYGRNTGDTGDRAGVLKSYDDGATWGTLVYVTAQNSAQNEMTLIERADRAIVAFIRQDGSPGVYTSTSTDIGVTWGAAGSIGFSTSATRPTAIMVPSSQTVILFYGQAVSGKPVWRYQLAGGAWSSEHVYTNLNPSTYAGGVAIADDLVGVVVAYEASSGSAIDFATMNVTKRLQTMTAGSGITLTNSSDGGDATIAVGSVTVTESGISLSDVTTDNVTNSAHGFAPKSPGDATKYLDGAATPAYKQVQDSDLSLSDITTNDVSTSKHGFAPKAPNDATKYLDGTGAYSVPAGGGGSTTWSVLTDGNSNLIFAGGDVVMVHSP